MLLLLQIHSIMETMPDHSPYLLDPKVYPEFERRRFKVPTWDTFENTTQSASLRDLNRREWREDLTAYTKQFYLGKVIWPLIHLLYSPHIGEAEK